MRLHFRTLGRSLLIRQGDEERGAGSSEISVDPRMGSILVRCRDLDEGGFRFRGVLMFHLFVLQ